VTYLPYLLPEHLGEYLCEKSTCIPYHHVGEYLLLEHLREFLCEKSTYLTYHHVGEYCIFVTRPYCLGVSMGSTGTLYS
jgi:hypothetical protein